MYLCQFSVANKTIEKICYFFIKMKLFYFIIIINYIKLYFLLFLNVRSYNLFINYIFVLYLYIIQLSLLH